MSEQEHQHDQGVIRADEQLVSGDSQPYFPARLGEPQLVLETEFGDKFYTATPRFRRVVAEWVAITAEATSDHLTFRWDGDDLIVIDDAALDPGDPASTPFVERVRPDTDGWPLLLRRVAVERPRRRRAAV
ncbi:hypothetical protein ACFVYA_31085 [Amycolatopsis sp. NPDC058278]|uniref:hypothetical protein n=1 Tax=Amycolatopsis sp. NPDC058278 TaxID=3346417 RepID=UPI0036DAF264